jgi:hypothetical protein
VTRLYADTSALARAYLQDEPDHPTLRSLLLEGPDVVVTSEITRVELTSALAAADRAGRLADLATLLARVEADCGVAGRILLLAFRPDVALPRARRLVLEHPLTTLDALHLAVALDEALGGDEEIVFVTRDDRQRVAAGAFGLEIR